MFKYILSSSSIAAMLGGESVIAVEPNPPSWDTNRVKILDPTDPQNNNQQTVDAIYSENGGNGAHGQWSDSRYAIMLLGGEHKINIKVGYYTQILGLGETPQDVTLDTFSSPSDSNFALGALCNFWRAAENFQTNNKVTWAVSQAAPIRRMIINNDIDLFQNGDSGEMGYASG